MSMKITPVTEGQTQINFKDGTAAPIPLYATIPVPETQSLS